MVRDKIFLLLAGLLLAVGCGGRRSSGSNYQLSTIHYQSGGVDTVKFGLLHEGEIAVKRLQLKNDSDQPLVVLRHDVSCGCVLAQYDRKPIATGESMPLTVRFDSRGARGWQMKLLRLYIAGEAEPYRIFIEADIE